MDALSYSYADKQAKRIKKFINNPDSNSGIVTFPKVIEAGETVTIKSGRQAILADTVIEGELVVEAGGDVFVPSGASISNLVHKTGDEVIAGTKTFSSTINGGISGNSATATKLQTARTINGVSFDGSANITVADSTAVKLTGDQTIAGTKTFNGLSKTSIGDNALEVITSDSNSAAGSFMVSQGIKYGLALNGSGTGLETGSFNFQVIDRDSKTVQNSPFNIGINGVVSYSFFPVTPSSAPTTNYQTANKKYVDDSNALKINKSEISYNVNTSSFIPNTLISGAIIERGSNANGDYVKFADGTMICQRIFEATNQAISDSYDSLFIGLRTWTYPATFITPPTCSSNIKWGSSSSWTILGGAEATNATFYVLDTASRASGTNTKFSFQAIGKWK